MDCVYWSGRYYIRIEAYNGNEFVISASCNPDQSTSPSRNDDCEGAVTSVYGAAYTEITFVERMPKRFSSTWEDNGAAYGVYFTVNSGDYNSFDFNATNLSNDNSGWAMLLGDGCGDLLSIAVGNTVTGTVAGSLSDAIILESKHRLLLCELD